MVSRNSTSVVQKEELQITIMLISVIIVFFVCQAPYVIYTAIGSITKFQVSLYPLLRLIFHCIYICLELDSAIRYKCDVVLGETMLFYAMLCYANTMLCYVILCNAIQHNPTLCCAM